MRTKLLLAALIAEAAVLAGSCGARSGLSVFQADARLDSGSGGGAIIDARSEEKDARSDVLPDVPPDVPPDVLFDGLAPCDPDALFVYLVTEETDLYRYDPAKGSFFLVGKLACSASGTPYSMGVSRTGTAYVLYSSPGIFDPNPIGKLYAVSIADASCQPTTFVPGQEGFHLFGMGFAIDDDGMGETLYVGATALTGASSIGLGSIDLESFELTYIGPFSQDLGDGPELTSSDDGQLYGYHFNPGVTGGKLVSINKATAEILESTPIPAGDDNSSFAFAYWSGDFYVFTSNNGPPTTITRYRPSDGSIQVVGSLAKSVVGAGVSTCAAR